jgi:hypothetical protein
LIEGSSPLCLRRLRSALRFPFPSSPRTGRRCAPCPQAGCAGSGTW